VKGGSSKPYSFSGLQKIVYQMRDNLDLPSHFTLEGADTVGMTEL
jgi:hypothetical protein